MCSISLSAESVVASPISAVIDDPAAKDEAAAAAAAVEEEEEEDAGSELTAASKLAVNGIVGVDEFSPREKPLENMKQKLEHRLMTMEWGND